MWIDVAALVVLLVFSGLGYLRGLFSQAWSLGSLFLCYLVTPGAYETVRTLLGQSERDTLLGEWVLRLLVGLSLYVILLLCGYVLEHLLVARFKLVSAGNRLMGAALGMVKGIIAVCLAAWVLTFFYPVVGSAQPGAETSSTSGKQTGVRSPSDADAQDEAVGQLQASRVAQGLAPYNPLNLLLLARVVPYLPQEVTGRKKAPSRLPKGVEHNGALQSLLNDAAFLEAYKQRNYLDLLMNPSFHRFVQDKALLNALEKTP